MLYKSSLLRLSLQRVTKQSEVCHWIVSANGGKSLGRGLQVFQNAPIDHGLEHAIDLTRLLSVKPLMENVIVSVADARTRGAYFCRAESQDDGWPL
jgi:hypothetical protein